MNSEELTNKIIKLMQTDNSVDAPKDSIKWAKGIFLTRSSQAQPSLLRRIVATLVSEIGPNAPAFGERSASASGVRQLLFSADDAAIDIRITKKGKKLGINGQVIGDAMGSATVTLGQTDSVHSTQTNEFGEFSFESVSPGNYQLSVSGTDTEIFVESIAII